MGLGIYSGTFSTSDNNFYVQGNPIPTNFKIIRTKAYGSYCTVAEIEWPDSKNYEGKKILVYHCSVRDLEKAKKLDPHFNNPRTHLTPLARFEPTERGWYWACQMAFEIVRKQNEEEFGETTDD